MKIKTNNKRHTNDPPITISKVKIDELLSGLMNEKEEQIYLPQIMSCPDAKKYYLQVKSVLPTIQARQKVIWQRIKTSRSTNIFRSPLPVYATGLTLALFCIIGLSVLYVTDYDLNTDDYNKPKSTDVQFKGADSNIHSLPLNKPPLETIIVQNPGGETRLFNGQIQYQDRIKYILYPKYSFQFSSPAELPKS